MTCVRGFRKRHGRERERTMEVTPKLKQENEKLIFLKGKKARTASHAGDSTRSPLGHIAIECCGTRKHCHISKEKRANAS